MPDGQHCAAVCAQSFMRIPTIPETTTEVTTVAAPEFGREWDYSAVEIRNISDRKSEW